MMEKILVCLDGSEFSEKVLPYITKDAIVLKSKVILMRVVHIPQSNVQLNIPGSPAVPMVTKGILERNVAEEKAAGDYLEKKSQLLGGMGMDVEYLVPTGHAGETIVNYARENNCTLIAIATHGHGGFRRLALGSTADYVVHNSVVPVLTVREG
jgi:nucleotide-binding universal stress UspA family protein